LVGDAGLEITRQELAIRVVQAYADWHGGHFKSTALQTSLQVHERLKAQIERRIAQGASPVIDRTLVQGRIAQVQVEFIAAQAQQASALSNLSQLAGKPVLASALLADVSRPLALGSAQSLVEQAQAGNPNVVKLIAIARTQEATIAERKADLSPDVYLRVERQFGNYGSLNAVPENRLFIGVTSRYGAGLSSQSQVSASLARLDAALADVESMRVSLSQQIMADYLLADSSELRLRSLRASLQSAADISQAWERQFLAGSKSWLDIMNATREQTQMEVQLAEVQATQVLLTWRLVLVAQGVWSLIDPGRTPVLRGLPPYEPVESPIELLFCDVLSVASKGLLAMHAMLSSPSETAQK
jgi:adhesin transport system outer membrane protein